ncbi:MAG TPA: methyltransferase domain-containing protein [Candidatus Saccharimonadales bacterium]|nr:methyltransferase domain-containing protein [Candidatus Saccharimonadales bacterium]
MFESFLWRVYGYVYDGLLSFYPYKKLINDVAEVTNVSSGAKVLELGCGTGNMLLEIGKRHDGVSLVGVDSSTSMLRMARKKFKQAKLSATFIRCSFDAYLAGVEDGSFDRIVLCNFVYTINPAKRTEFWLEALRVLKPDGQIIIADPESVGQESLIKQHIAYDKWWRLLNPRLISIAIIDSFIDRYIAKGKFELAGAKKITSELNRVGVTTELVGRTYGTSADGLDFLITATKHAS